MRPGLLCDFRTGAVHISPLSFATAAQAAPMLLAIVREVQRFERAVQDGIKTEADYRVWAAAEEAPPLLAKAG